MGAVQTSHLRPAIRDRRDPVGIAADVRRVIAATAIERDRDRILPSAEIDAIRASGLLAARVPEAFGGLGASLLEVARIFIELGRGDPNVGQALGPHFAFVEKLLLFRNAKDQQVHFPRIAGGALYANAIAEKGGAVVGELSVRLSTDGDGFRLSGRKDYCTGGLFAGYLYVTGILDDGRPAQVVVPADRSGITRTDDWNGFGQRTTTSGSTTFDNVAVARPELLEESIGAKKRSPFGASSQLHHAALDAGIALAALDDAVANARRSRPVPEAGVKHASEDSYALHTVGEMATIAHAAVALIERAAGELDVVTEEFVAGRVDDDRLAAVSIAVAEAKAIANQASLSTSEMLFRVGGASSSDRSLGFDRHWRNARTHTLHDPVAYKYRAIGDFLLNGTKPPVNAKY